MARVSAIALVAGSGMAFDRLLDRIDDERPFTEFPALRPCSVTGHVGRFIFGTCGIRPVIVQQGRLHVYEGLTIDEAAATVDVLHELGARQIIFTNAAGGLQPGTPCGSLLAIDRIATWPYARWHHAPERITPTFHVHGCDARGAYLWVHGPSYETRAEIAAMQRMNLHAVGMSTAPEMHRAHQLRLQTAAISCITNECAIPQKLSHDHVLAAAAAATARLITLLRTHITTT